MTRTSRENGDNLWLFFVEQVDVVAFRLGCLCSNDENCHSWRHDHVIVIVFFCRGHRGCQDNTSRGTPSLLSVSLNKNNAVFHCDDAVLGLYGNAAPNLGHQYNFVFFAKRLRFSALVLCLRTVLAAWRSTMLTLTCANATGCIFSGLDPCCGCSLDPSLWAVLHTQLRPTTLSAHSYLSSLKGCGQVEIKGG